MVVLLVRHAAAEQTGRRLYGRSPGVHLSHRGEEEARRLADRLADVPLAAVYTSPLDRCVETARAIAGGRGLRLRRLSGLDEVDYGEWTGRSIAVVRRTRMWRRLRASPSSARFPGGEGLRDVQRRAVDAVEAIAARHEGVVVAVTHGDVVRLALAHFAGVHIDLFQRLEIGTASVTALALGDGADPRILRVNDTGGVDDLVSPQGG